MSLLSSLFQSKTMQDAAFGAVKKMMKEGNYKYFLIEIDQDGELTLNTYTHEQQPVMMSIEQMTSIELAMENLSKAGEELEKQLEAHLSEQTKLSQMCKEQEQMIISLSNKLYKLNPEIDPLTYANPENNGAESEA